MTKQSRISYVKKWVSLFLVMTLVITGMPLTTTSIFAKEDTDKGRFLVVYEEEKPDSLSRSFKIAAEDSLGQVEIISQGKEQIVVVEDTRLNIISSLKNKKILALEADQAISLLADQDLEQPQKPKAANRPAGKEDREEEGEAENSRKIEEKEEAESPQTGENTEKKPEESPKAKERAEDQTDPSKIEGKKPEDLAESPEISLPEEGEKIDHILQQYMSQSKGKNMKIALIDSGVDTDHTGIVLAGGHSFIDSAYDRDENGHGTGLAGLIKGYQTADGETFAGLAPQADLYSLKVLDAAGRGYYSQVIKALDWARQEKIDIVIMAFGAREYSAILHRAIQKAYFQDMLLVAAGGKGDDQVYYPAAYTEVMAVGSSSRDQILYHYTNKDLVEIYAEGDDLPSIQPLGRAIKGRGSSYSATLIGAVAAGLWSKDPGLNAREIRGLVKKAARVIEVGGESYLLADGQKAHALQDQGEVPVAKDYDSEVKEEGIEKPEENPQVSSLAEIRLSASSIKIWESLSVNVKFAHNYSRAVAKLTWLGSYYREKAGSNQSVEIKNIKGQYKEKTSDDPSEYIGPSYEFKFAPTYNRGDYGIGIELYEEEDENSLARERYYLSDDIFMFGSDLYIPYFKLGSQKDIILGKESLKGEVGIRNYQDWSSEPISPTHYSIDYPTDVEVEFYAVKNNSTDFTLPSREELLKEKAEYEKFLQSNPDKLKYAGLSRPIKYLSSQQVLKKDLEKNKLAVVNFEWTPAR